MKRSLGAQTFLYPTPVMLVGSYDQAGRANLMTAAWGGVCCSKPPCISISLREATYTYANIQARKAFTICLGSSAQVAVADYLGIYSGRDEDKFKACGLKMVASDVVDAPYADEFGVVLECRLVHQHCLGLHTLFVGEVCDTKIESDLIDEQGRVDLDTLSPLAYAPVNREYYSLGKVIGKAFQVGKKK